MIFLKLIFLTGFCVLNTNALLDRGENDTCIDIVEDPNFAFSDLQIIDCHFVKIYDIKLTDYGLEFTVKHPKIRNPDILKLNRTEQKLFNKDTVITFAEKSKGEDGDEWNNIETTTLGQYLPGFDDVTLFHNYNRHISIVLYRKGSNYYVEGNIRGKILRYIDNKDYVADEPTYVLAQMGPLNNELLKKEYYSLRVDQKFYDLGSKYNRIHINLLPIIDGRILNYGIIDARTLFRPILTYFNYIDMLFGIFSSPIISFTIKGFVIPKNDVLLPYIDQSNSVPSTIFLSNVNRGLGNFMATQKMNFDLTSNDIVMFIAGRRIYDDVTVSDGSIPSTTFYKRSMCEKSVHPLTTISVYSDFINDYFLWHLISKFVTTSQIKEALKYSILTPNLGCPGFPENFVEMNGRKRSYVSWIDDCLANMMSHYFKHHDCSAFNKH